MPTIAEVRAKYPQYKDLDDTQLADGLYKKFYSDLPREEFDAKLGLKPAAEVQEPEKAPAREMGLTEYAMQSLPFGDEIGAAAAATGKTIAKVIKGEDTSWGADYDASRAGDEAAREQFSEEHPNQALLGQAAAIASTGSPGTTAAAAPTLAGRVWQGAKSSAVVGGAMGAGEGDGLEERVENAGIGAGLGALGGAVAAPLVEGVIGAGSLAKKALAPLRGAVNPEAEAARRVATALEADGGPGAAVRAAGVLDDAQNAGTPLIVADTGGETTRALARSARNTSNEAGDALNSTVSSRFENQSERMSGVLKDITGAQGDTAATLERVQQAARHTNRKAYNAAFKEGSVGAWDDDLVQLAQAPSVQDAIRKTTRTGANRAAADGFEVQTNPFEFKDGVMALRAKADGTTATPTLQFWDSVKRNLDDEIGQLQRSGAKSEAADALALKSILVQKMDDMFPSYKTARAGAAEFFGAEDALEAGSKFVASNVENGTAKRAFDAMSEPEKKLFREGYANEILRRVGGMGDSRNVAGSTLFKSPQARERAEMVLGRQGSRKLEAAVTVENIMNVTKTAVQGNSSTAKQLVELGLAGGASGGIGAYATGGDVSTSVILGGILGAGMRKGYNLIDQKVATRVGQMLASSDPEVVRRGMKMVSHNPRLLEGLRKAEEYLGRLFAPAIATGAASDAEATSP